MGKHKNNTIHFSLSRKSCCSLPFWYRLFLCILYFSHFLFLTSFVIWFFSYFSILVVPFGYLIPHTSFQTVLIFLQISQLRVLFLILNLYSLFSHTSSFSSQSQCPFPASFPALHPFLSINCSFSYGVWDKVSPEVTESLEGWWPPSQTRWFSPTKSIVVYFLTCEEVDH